MQDIEPYYNWRHLYIASEDDRSPLYGYFNSEVYYTDVMYDFVIHPQWDNIGCETLFIKILYADYEEGFAIIELFGEWNDVLHNDIMTLKREIIDMMLDQGIDKYILIAENVLNFHADITDYYDEWLEEVPDGWIAFLNAREHVARELADYHIDQYLLLGGKMSDIAWRTKSPLKLYREIKSLAEKRLGM
ncbi:MAG: hypothetical protein EP346_13240 [Bacteroidetes bacterium]|uniref:Uncharacterized protein n=1 Tax=Phaeocystidibacter marisrubri TaxID=1577780 RepID=A0A6L3ZIF9_9FLAO|nr:hypothetical protein [Phaeocystidibacter marisrubri]KAB2817358.1 hypothetical protein F8C82_02900 [Phaeocystidibacter marisrubri]TNE26954.1 MAG: hypothetical protein EP346_13240 [Bacteroidota bacterium]GGH75753.1 hypothetical protein GCM10011318_23090 [Phaeocystidibacter marisrubri]